MVPDCFSNLHMNKTEFSKPASTSCAKFQKRLFFFSLHFSHLSFSAAHCETKGIGKCGGVGLFVGFIFF